MGNVSKTKKQLERERREERATRMAYLGTLASGLAHEIRSPLNAMQLNLDLLKEDLEAVNEEKRAEFGRRLGLISREVEGLNKLLTDFLAFARHRLRDPPQQMSAGQTQLRSGAATRHR